MNKSEVTITDEFKNHILKKYTVKEPCGKLLIPYFHKVHMTGMGVAGKPDCEVIIPAIPTSPILSVELKKCKSFKSSLTNLRPTQKAHFRMLRLSKYIYGFLLWSTGCARMLENSTSKLGAKESWEVIEDVDGEMFSGFDMFVNQMIEKGLK